MSLIESVPRVLLGTWPTPVVTLEESSSQFGIPILAKVESASGAWGATKVRKLEYLLARAERSGVARLSTAGVGSSTWAASVALHGSERGFDVTVWLAKPPPPELRRLYDRTGTRVRVLPGLASAPIAAAGARLGPGYLPPGGSGDIGDVGTVRAGLEISADVAAGRLEEPAAVFVACGTAGTAAGLAIGMAAGGLSCPLVAVRVTPRPLGTSRLVRRRMDGLVRLLDFAGAPATVISENGVGPGYGKPGEAGLEAMDRARRDGIDLDPGYAAKAYAALLRWAREHPRRGPLLLLATSPGPPPYSA